MVLVLCLPHSRFLEFQPLCLRRWRAVNTVSNKSDFLPLVLGHCAIWIKLKLRPRFQSFIIHVYRKLTVFIRLGQTLFRHRSSVRRYKICSRWLVVLDATFCNSGLRSIRHLTCANIMQELGCQRLRVLQRFLSLLNAPVDFGARKVRLRYCTHNVSVSTCMLFGVCFSVSLEACVVWLLCWFNLTQVSGLMVCLFVIAQKAIELAASVLQTSKSLLYQWKGSFVQLSLRLDMLVLMDDVLSGFSRDFYNLIRWSRFWIFIILKLHKMR